MKKEQDNSRNNNRAFTLIELLVVIAIIAILTGITVTSLSGSKAKARDAKRISDLGQIQLALELFFDRCKQYPSALDTTSNGGLGATNGCPSNIGLSTYISKIPTAPNPGSYSYSINDNTNPINPSDYVLHVELENPNEIVKDGRQSTDGIVTPPTCDLIKNYCLGPK